MGKFSRISKVRMNNINSCCSDGLSLQGRLEYIYVCMDTFTAPQSLNILCMGLWKLWVTSCIPSQLIQVEMMADLTGTESSCLGTAER